MRRYHLYSIMCLVSLAVFVSSCKKDDATTAPTTQVPSLIASPSGVTLASSTSQNVTITSGVHPYIIAQQPNPSLATVQFVNANLDTAVLVITGVSTATGSTSVVIRDASLPQRSVAIGITKTP